MAGKDEVELQLLEAVEGVEPLVDVAVADVSGAGQNEVAGEDDPLVRQQDDDVAAGVAAAEMEQLDRPVPALEGAVDRHPARQGDVGRRRRRLADRHVVRLLDTDRVQCLVLLLAVVHRVRRVLHRGDLVRDVPGEDRGGRLAHHVRHQHLSRELVADDRDVLGERLVPVGVVEVVVRVDQMGDRLVGHLGDRCDQGAGGCGRDVGVDDQGVLVAQDQHRVALDEDHVVPADDEVDAGRHLLKRVGVGEDRAVGRRLFAAAAGEAEGQGGDGEAGRGESVGRAHGSCSSVSVQRES